MGNGQVGVHGPRYKDPQEIIQGQYFNSKLSLVTSSPVASVMNNSTRNEHRVC
jgi:hypothetical protein